MCPVPCADWVFNMSVEKAKFFAFEVYQENISSFDDLFDSLVSKFVPFAISPLHDKDKYKDGTFKKPHYHVMICYNNNVTVDFIKRLYKGIASNDYVIILRNQWGYYTYLYHDPLYYSNKVPYDEQEVRFYLCGKEDFSKFQSESAKSSFLFELFDFIDDNDIRSYYQFLSWSRSNNYDYFIYAMSNQGSSLINNLCSSRNAHKRGLYND